VIVTVTGGSTHPGSSSSLKEEHIKHHHNTDVSESTELASSIYLRLALEQAKAIGTNALQLALESVQSDNAKLKVVANALLVKTLKDMNMDLNLVSRGMEEYLKANSIEGSSSIDEKAKTITVTWKDRLGTTQNVTIGNNAQFGSLSVFGRVRGFAGRILPRLLGVAARAERTAMDIFLLPFDSTVSAGSLISETLVSVAASLTKNRLITGSGLIYDISRNVDLQNLIANSLDLQQVGELPDWLQKVIAAREMSREAITKALSDENLLTAGRTEPADEGAPVDTANTRPCCVPIRGRHNQELI